MENKKILCKLPDWAVTRWNRAVTDALDSNGMYSPFAAIVAFMMKEARVTNNNPV